MTKEELIALIQNIVSQSLEMSIKHTKKINTPVNYACVFSHSEKEYETLSLLAQEIGTSVRETPTGPLFYVTGISTVAGDLPLVKIRRPDKGRPERGDADFTIDEYPTFKNEFLKKTGFTLITRPSMEMIELADPSYNVLAYYSHPTLAQELGI